MIGTFLSDFLLPVVGFACIAFLFIATLADLHRNG